jgi:hypothetical protein
MASPIYSLEVAPVWHDESLPPQPASNTLLIALVLEVVLFNPILPDVADVFEKEKDQDVVLVFRRVYNAAESVTGFPCDSVYFTLGYFGLGHLMVAPLITFDGAVEDARENTEKMEITEQTESF